MTELDTVGGSSLVLDSQQTYWNDQQIAALRQLGVEQATTGDLQVFHHVCQRTGLDPFARQIYMIERLGKQTIQTGIDGYRLVARRSVDHSREKLSIGSPEWCDWEGNWHEVWLQDGPPAAARVTVMRDDAPFPAIALWREYVQTRRDGSVTAMWRSRPAGQLAKCAEALALRKAFPQDLSGIYVDAEMDKADVVQGEVVQERPKSRVEQALDAQTSGAEDAADAPSPQSAERPSPSAPESPYLNTRGKLARRMFALFGEIGLTEKPDRLAYVSDVIGRTVTTSGEMTDADAERVCAAIEADRAAAQPPAAPVGPLCPECAQGKHVNCEGQAWDTDTDQPVGCTCPDGSHQS